MYRTLQSDKIVDTAFVLAQRVSERFPHSGLSKVAAELTETSKDIVGIAQSIGRPMLPLRIFSMVVPGQWFVTAARSIMLKGVGLEYLWRETLILGGMALVLVAVSARAFKARLE